MQQGQKKEEEERSLHSMIASYNIMWNLDQTSPYGIIKF
jgi:hypothetical protein